MRFFLVDSEDVVIELRVVVEEDGDLESEIKPSLACFQMKVRGGNAWVDIGEMHCQTACPSQRFMILLLLYIMPLECLHRFLRHKNRIMSSEINDEQCVLWTCV